MESMLTWPNTAFFANAEKQKQYSWFDSRPDGVLLGQKVTPLARAGVYVPGGKAAYPSFSSGKLCAKAVNLLRDLCCQRLAGGDQNSACQFVMLCLRQQVSRHM